MQYPDEDLADLRHHWGDAYEITHPRRAVWLARRRDDGEILTAIRADALLAKIRLDYHARPVPR